MADSSLVSLGASRGKHVEQWNCGCAGVSPWRLVDPCCKSLLCSQEIAHAIPYAAVRIGSLVIVHRRCFCFMGGLPRVVLGCDLNQQRVVAKTVLTVSDVVVDEREDSFHSR